MFNLDKKKQALEKLEKSQRNYEQAISDAEIALEKLYMNRKKALLCIDSFEEIIKNSSIMNNTDYLLRISNAKASIRPFIESVEKEISLKSYKENINNVQKDYLNKTVIEAISTALTGGVLTQTVLKTLGSNLSISNVIRGLAGPIGWTFGSVLAGMDILKFAVNNRKIAAEANEMTQKISEKTETIKSLTRKIIKLNKDIRKDTDYLNNMSLSFMNATDGYDLNNIVNIIEGLCRKISKKFSIY